MRRFLDFLYDGAAWLAALAMVGLLAMVLLWLTEGPPAAASGAPERLEWREFEEFLKQL